MVCGVVMSGSCMSRNEGGAGPGVFDFVIYLYGCVGEGRMMCLCVPCVAAAAAAAAAKGETRPHHHERGSILSISHIYDGQQPETTGST
jgi:hypothetical protein